MFFPLLALRVRDGIVQRKEVHDRFGFFQCQGESQIVKRIAFEDGSELLVDQLECPCLVRSPLPTSARATPGLSAATTGTPDSKSETNHDNGHLHYSRTSLLVVDRFTLDSTTPSLWRVGSKPSSESAFLF